MHPEGKFEAEILDHGFCKSGLKGSPQFFAKFKTEAGEITGFFPLTHKAKQYTIEKIRNMGFQGDSMEDLADGMAMRGYWCDATR